MSYNLEEETYKKVLLLFNLNSEDVYNILIRDILSLSDLEYRNKVIESILTNKENIVDINNDIALHLNKLSDGIVTVLIDLGLLGLLNKDLIDYELNRDTLVKNYAGRYKLFPLVYTFVFNLMTTVSNNSLYLEHYLPLYKEYGKKERMRLNKSKIIDTKREDFKYLYNFSVSNVEQLTVFLEDYIKGDNYRLVIDIEGARQISDEFYGYVKNDYNELLSLNILLLVSKFMVTGNRGLLLSIFNKRARNITRDNLLSYLELNGLYNALIQGDKDGIIKYIKKIDSISI